MHLKPSASPSPHLVPPSAGPSSKPPMDQSQTHGDLLAQLGIKVRDFAYESKLPPVPSYRVRQIQPGPRPLKRTRTDGEVDDVFQDNNRTEAAEGNSSRKSKLKREDTEPDVTQHQPRPSRALGFLNIHDLYRDPDVLPLSQSQSQPAKYSQPSDFSPYRSDSQELEPYVVTPVVTPNGSLQWPDVITISDIPASQLDTESQANDPLLLTYSQLGMPESIETESGPSTEPEPKTEPSDTTGTGPSDSWTLNAHSRSSTPSPSPQRPSTTTSRYQLRKRPIRASSQSPTKTGVRDPKS
ncbi:hypothetical protein C0995_005432 [Termitomyces sp. Mi166|nr:hypothetical protein C0995_005432 [Termitomyces sp. Mi166\